MGALMTAVGTALTAVVTVLVTWFVRRTDRAARLTQANMHDQEYILKLVGALRDDYWAIIDWAYATRSKFMQLAFLNRSAPEDMTVLPPIPTPKHRELENARIQISNEDGK